MRTVQALWIRNIKNFVRDRTRLIFSIIIPFFFVYVFSSIFKNDQIDNPVAFLLAGVIIATVFQTSLSLATTTIDDIVSGFMKEILVSPAKRFHIAFGQLLSSATVSTFQGILIVIIGMFVGLKFDSILTPILVVLIMGMVGLVFAGLGLFLATTVKSSQTFQVVQTAIILPFTFLSGAYLPLSLLPNLLRYFAYLNPMTYTTAFFRTIILEQSNASTTSLLEQGLAFKINGFIIMPYMSGIIILIFGIIFISLATRAFIIADFSKINRNKNEKEIL